MDSSDQENPKHPSKPIAQISKAPEPITPLRGSYHRPLQNDSPPAPDWTFWSQILDASLVEAVALSCNCEPRSRAFQFERKESDENTYSTEFRIFTDRLAIAKSHLGVSLPFKSLNLGDSGLHRVGLDEFAAWAKLKKWQPFPEPFAAMASAEVVAALAKKMTIVQTSSAEDIGSHSSKGFPADKPLGTRERNNLLVLIAALAKLAKLDVTKPSKAAGIIAQASEELGSPLPVRTIEKHLGRINEALERRAK